MIANALVGKSLPAHNDGEQIRGGLYVGDHCSGIRVVTTHDQLITCVTDWAGRAG